MHASRKCHVALDIRSVQVKYPGLGKLCGIPVGGTQHAIDHIALREPYTLIHHIPRDVPCRGLYRTQPAQGFFDHATHENRFFEYSIQCGRMGKESPEGVEDQSFNGGNATEHDDQHVAADFVISESVLR